MNPTLPGIQVPAGIKIDTPPATPVVNPAPVIAPVTDITPQTPPANNLVVTAAKATNDFNTHSSNLQSILGNLNQPAVPPENVGKGGIDSGVTDTSQDPYIQMLNSASATSGQATKALVSSIIANRSAQGNKIDAQYDNYKRGLQLMGIQHNSAQYTPDLLAGHIQQAENEHQSKLQALDVEEKKALMDAEDAQSKNQLDILGKSMARIKDIQTAKSDVLKNIAEASGQTKTITENDAASYFDKINTLNPNDKEAFIHALAARDHVPVTALTQALSDQALKNNKASLENTRLIQEINKANSTTGDGATLTPSVINTLKKANPLIDLSYGDDKSTAINAVNIAGKITNGIKQAAENPENLDDKGYFTSEFLKKYLTNVVDKSDGISRDGFLKSIKDKIYLGKDEDAIKSYGLTSEEIATLKSE